MAGGNTLSEDGHGEKGIGITIVDGTGTGTNGLTVTREGMTIAITIGTEPFPLDNGVPTKNPAASNGPGTTPGCAGTCGSRANVTGETRLQHRRRSDHSPGAYPTVCARITCCSELRLRSCPIFSRSIEARTTTARPATAP